MHKNHIGLREILVFSAAVAVWVGCQPAAVEETTEEPAPTAVEEPEPAAPPHWDYGEAGPAVWGQLSADYAACAEGQSQSPIDIESAAADESGAQAALSFTSIDETPVVVNNGHSIQVNYAGASSVTAGDASFGLLQFHFHSPSEHTVDGEHYPMEMHMVHQSADGALAVVGVMIAEGAENLALAPIWAAIPAEEGGQSTLEGASVDVASLVPESREVYHYEGSLTTPPCSEGVHWFVMTTPIEASADQVEAFQSVMVGNNRPVQPLNDRVVVTDSI